MRTIRFYITRKVPRPFVSPPVRKYARLRPLPVKRHECAPDEDRDREHWSQGETSAGLENAGHSKDDDLGMDGRHDELPISLRVSFHLGIQSKAARVFFLNT